MKWIFIAILIGFCIHIILDIVSDLLVMFSEKIRNQLIKKLIEEHGLDRYLLRIAFSFLMSNILLLFLFIIAIISIIK